MAARKKKEIVDESIDLLFAQNSTDAYKVSAPKPDSDTTKKNNPLFDTINAIFNGRMDYINNITDQQAKQNMFMILRRVGIGYPEMANAFNKPNINAMDAIKSLTAILSRYPSPGWLYTSVQQAKKTVSKTDITKADIDEYIKHYNITRKDFDSALSLFTEETIKEVIELREFIKNSTKIKNGKEDTDYE